MVPEPKQKVEEDLDVHGVTGKRAGHMTGFSQGGSPASAPAQRFSWNNANGVCVPLKKSPSRNLRE